MQQQTQRKFFPQEEIAMGHREELLSTLSSTGLPYLFMLLSSLYQSTSANICSFPICKCMLNKAIYFSWSQGSPSINLSLIVCSGCNYPCRSQRPTFKLETKFLWTNNKDTSKLPDCFARQSVLQMVSPYMFLYTARTDERSSESKVTPASNSLGFSLPTPCSLV